MNIRDFKAGEFKQQYDYKSFSPKNINYSWEIADGDIQQLLSDADRVLGELNAFSQLVPDVDFFIRMHITKEATQSSRIEGTRTNMEEALLDEKDIAPEKKDDWVEVQNYVKAINDAIGQLQTLPLSNRLLRDTHRVLMQGVRGATKQPGEFRNSQNWIGMSLKNAVFIPPHQDEVGELMSDMEKFIHNDELKVPHLIKIAIAHYQFETIHPFLDGNGRVGRLMITLYLVNKGILKKPILYISDFLETHRRLYYENLMSVRNKNDLSQWFKFFLVGVIETSKKGIATFDSILQLQKQVEIKLQTLGSRAANAQKIINYLYQRPSINAEKVSETAKISLPSAYKLIADLEKLEILKEITGGQRGRVYVFNSYIQLFQW